MRVKQKGIRNTPNKPWWVEIVTSRNRLYRPYAISEHSLFIYHKDWEFTHEFFQGKPNIDEYVQIQTSVQERNCMKSESLSKVHSWESLIFQICNLFHRFSKYIYNDYLLANMLLIHFSCYFGKQRWFLPPRHLHVSHLFCSCSFENCF